MMARERVVHHWTRSLSVAGMDVWNAFHGGGSSFGPANGMWFGHGQPTFYRYSP